MLTNGKFIIYGANGYTGQLIAETAKQYGLSPILAGRNEAQLAPLAEKLGLSYRIATIDNPGQLASLLADCTLLLHAAGPFQFTARHMMMACLQSNTHYLDITGEIPVFEMAANFNNAALEAGIMIMPGVGFDVVPTDCLAAFLENLLPDANQLKLAFASLNGMVSHGTAMTMAMGLGAGSAARVNGKIVAKRLGEKGMLVDFGEKKLFVMSIPWGDVSTAYYTTGIPNIETYTAVPKSLYYALKFQSLYNWALKTKPVQRFIKKKIGQRPAGPNTTQRSNSSSLVWGEVQNNNGKIIQGKINCPDGYTLTVHSSLLIAKKVLDGSFIPGFQTPAGAYGANLILEIPGSRLQKI
jgi:short subunit dehydrogenase-like uncharacterized protein